MDGRCSRDLTVIQLRKTLKTSLHTRNQVVHLQVLEFLQYNFIFHAFQWIIRIWEFISPRGLPLDVPSTLISRHTDPVSYWQKKKAALPQSARVQCKRLHEAQQTVCGVNGFLCVCQPRGDFLWTFILVEDPGRKTGEFFSPPCVWANHFFLNLFNS